MYSVDWQKMWCAAWESLAIVSGLLLLMFLLYLDKDLFLWTAAENLVYDG